MRVVSWNVRSLRDDSRGVAALLRSLAPDVVVLQEAPRLVLWRLARRRLAHRAGLRVATRGRAAGNCVLLRPGLRASSSYAVVAPKRPGLHRRATAGVVVDGVCVAGTHLDLREDARLDTARRVRAAAGAPLVLCADLNDVPGSATWSVLSAGLVDGGTALTFLVGGPTRRIDGVFVDPALAVVGHEVVASRASDHLPLVVDLVLPDGDAPRSPRGPLTG